MKTRTTSQDVADLAGVSRSAVSRFFSGGHVSENYKKKIIKASEELSYRPNMIARSMTGMETNLIALITGEGGSTPSLKEIEDKLIFKLSSYGKRALMIPVTEKDDLDESTKNALDYQVDAIVVLGGNVSASVVEHLQALRVPLLLYGTTEGAPGTECFCCKNEKAGHLVGRFLIRTGHKRIAYLAKIKDTNANVTRKKGLVDELSIANMELYAEERGDITYEKSKSAGLRLFSMSEPPDAVFCFNDIMAIGALDAARAMKIRIPEDASIVGFDDIPQSSWDSFRLTTVNSNIDFLIDKMVQRILDKSSSEKNGEFRMWWSEPELIIRSTTK